MWRRTAHKVVFSIIGGLRGLAAAVTLAALALFAPAAIFCLFTTSFWEEA